MSDATINLSDDDATSTPAPKKPARKTVARLTLAAIALLVLGGGWYAYERVHGTAGIPMAAANDFVPDGSGGGGMRFGGFRGGNRPPAPPQPGLNADGVNVMPGNVVSVRAGATSMRGVGRADGKWQLTFNRQGAADDREAIQLYNQTRRRILEPRRPAAELKVTDAQRAALASAVPESPAELAAGAFARASALLAELSKLPPADAKATPLKDELQAIATTASKADAGAIAKEYEARAAKIRAILSAEQIDTLLDRRPAAKPVAAAPATKPAGK